MKRLASAGEGVRNADPTIAFQHVSRWPKGTGSPGLKTQTIIAELRYVVDRLSDFYAPDETRLWLHARYRLLGGERAVALVNGGQTEEVLAVIGRLDAGAYV